MDKEWNGSAMARNRRMDCDGDWGRDGRGLASEGVVKDQRRMEGVGWDTASLGNCNSWQTKTRSQTQL